jgi:photosystem II stability/assembly factor-like uncharacterized protein
LDPANPATIYAATGTGVYKSSDGGSTWGFSGLAANYPVAVAVDPLNTSRILVGMGVGAAIAISPDGGTTWKRVYTDPVQDGVTSFAFDPLNPKVMYASLQQVDWSQPGAVLKSTDGGKTWTDSDAGIAGGIVTDVDVDPSDPGTVYASTFYGGVFVSTDTGATWAPENQGLMTMAVDNLAMTPGGATLWAGTEEGAFSRSV